MTSDEFKKFWTNRYPDSVPISYTFRHNYPDRWFRIHSLPGSKRYPDNDNDWAIILHRQNTLITDLFGDDPEILLVSGEYHFEDHNESAPFNVVDPFKEFSFTNLDAIDLHKRWPEEYDKGSFFRPMFSKLVWSPGKFNRLLRDVALDSVRVFLVSVNHNTIIVPYDGGIDVILKDRETRDQYKSNYIDWLSERYDGL